MRCNRIYASKDPAVSLSGVAEGVVEDNTLYNNTCNSVSVDKHTSCMVLNNHTAPPPQVRQIGYVLSCHHMAAEIICFKVIDHFFIVYIEYIESHSGHM